ncbi:MAG TPA: Hpt domain-containing protein [Stellaceae bacterium]|jgi:HPt (histidine-containing phosphotransfer) domain-containing protein/CheY-like chemotaxis protein|nr:Hpt domain-containing protein [Stellaceae bacterium]
MAAKTLVPAEDPFVNLRQTFREESEERLGQMDRLIEAALHGVTPLPGALSQLRRDTHTLKGMGEASGFPLVSLVAHRLENYLDDMDLGQGEAALLDIRAHVDAMAEAMDSAASDDAFVAAALRALPMPRAFNPDEIELRNVEALLVTSSRVVGRLVARELAACGIRAILTQSATEAFTLAIRMKPNLIIASATMAELPGTDLARALAAMATTHRIPVAILTSLDEGELSKHLPAGIPTIHTGASLSGDLAAVITRYGIG